MDHNESGGDAPANEHGAPDGANDMVSRAELDRAIQRRQAALDEKRAVEAERDKLLAQLADAKRANRSNPQSMKAPADAGTEASDLDTMQAKLDQLESKWHEREAAERRSAFEGQILGSIKPATLPVARLVLRGLMADGEITMDADAGEVRKSLAARYPDVFVAAATVNPRQGTERSHAHISTPAGVEPGDMANVSSEDFRRMVALGQGPRPLI